MWIDLLGAAAVVGQCLDAFTTYWGLYILKKDSEGNANPIAQWIAKSKIRLLTIKPAGAIVTAVALHHYAHVTNAAALFAICAIALAVSGLDAGIQNLILNIKQAEAK